MKSPLSAAALSAGPTQVSLLARFETNLEKSGHQLLNGAAPTENADFIAACCWAISREEGTALARQKNQGNKLTEILVAEGLVVVDEDGARTLTPAGRERATYYSLKQLGA